jgi:hypothetical protein
MIHNFYSLTIILSVIKWRTVTSLGHVACMGTLRNIIIGCDSVDWIHLVYDKVQCRAELNTVLNLGASEGLNYRSYIFTYFLYSYNLLKCKLVTSYYFRLTPLPLTHSISVGYVQCLEDSSRLHSTAWLRRYSRSTYTDNGLHLKQFVWD